MKLKRVISFALAAIMLLSLFGCGKKSDSKSTDESSPDSAETAKTVNIEISVKDFGIMKLELYPDVAPITVENFVSLVDDGFYDGLTFHRIVKDFMIQGGDPSGDGTGGSENKIKGEFSENGVDNKLSHTRGVISMARSMQPDSASSQFFICTSDKYTGSLDGKYAAFGKVTEGLDVLDAIAAVKVAKGSMSSEVSSPVTPVVIEYIKLAD